MKMRKGEGKFTTIMGRKFTIILGSCRGTVDVDEIGDGHWTNKQEVRNEIDRLGYRLGGERGLKVTLEHRFRSPDIDIGKAWRRYSIDENNNWVRVT